MKKSFLLLLVALSMTSVTQAIDNKGISFNEPSQDRFSVIENGQALPILIDAADNSAVQIAAKSLQKDLQAVSGSAQAPAILNGVVQNSGNLIIVGSMESKFIKQLVKAKKINGKELTGKCEKYIMTMVKNPMEGVDEALVIAGSDRRGAVYGIYELSEQIGVSPWYFWADVPVAQQRNISLVRGTYTAGEPAVRYRGIFLNDEDPCLTGWVKNHYGTNYGGHDFYADCFELILRLRGNFMWPAMWGWAFYADDPENSKTANDMGIIMGTSHHEPMARNHQEYARNRGAYGTWDYNTNPEGLDRFFREGIERSIDNEDLVTIGMRGDGDAALGGDGVNSDEENIASLEKVIAAQRNIIKEVTGKPAEKRQQVWALYKEVQIYYEKGLRVPDDVIILLSDDNWGDVRRLPNAEERKRKGGWGMYYHVDYVGAPRNSKWLNITPIQHMWEQMQLTYKYGVDKIWVLNVGDLKPMEYPITLFLDMAWNPTEFTADNLLDHTVEFCTQQFGTDQAAEAARILNLYSKYAGRVTAEMLDARTYNLETGEWAQVCNDFVRLEAEALRQYLKLDDGCRDAYQQIILFPIQALGNVYDMYYAQAMNRKLAAANDPDANIWADRVHADFLRDAELMKYYNKEMAGGKWDGMMTQKHIGYRSWNDNFRADTEPSTTRVADTIQGGFVFSPSNGYIAMEAEHFFAKTDAAAAKGKTAAKWQVIPFHGRTRSGVALFPYDAPRTGASLTYKFSLPEGTDKVTLHAIVNATLPFYRAEGHRYMVSVDGGQAVEVNFNSRLNEDPANVYSIYYPTVAGRVVETTLELNMGQATDGLHTMTVSPVEPGTVFQKFVLDFGGYQKSFLFMDESPLKR